MSMRKLKLILLGAPGAGKGTQAEQIAKAYKIPAISTGAIIRQAVKDETEIGKIAKELIDGGKLVPDKIVIGIVKERLAQDDCKNGFILDGFPRTVSQAIALDELDVGINCVLSIEVSDENIMKRMTGRRVCPKCGQTFHSIYNPSPKGIFCTCGEKLTQRNDDKPEVVADRLCIYHRDTEPLKDYYRERGLLKVVVGQEKLEDTTALTNKALKTDEL